MLILILLVVFSVGGVYFMVRYTNWIAIATGVAVGGFAFWTLSSLLAGLAPNQQFALSALFSLITFGLVGGSGIGQSLQNREIKAVHSMRQRATASAQAADKLRNS